ncbi:MAG: DegT/DnrJ/EryC1/StrS family aminotransferase [Deltaproteobacteria bacterium]|nr:DegT/DnrJ/EryC1/StrS family aminotransferase [Deltaproteobacteria bacterium]
MDFIDLAAQQRRISDKLQANIARVLAHGQYINGPEVRELEAALAAYVGAKHAVGCASGTDALIMALMALEIGPGDAVFTTPFTFVATAEVISLVGATPVFVDIDPATFNIDPAKLSQAIEAVEKGDPALHPLPGGGAGKLRPRAVIPVDLFGLPADYDAIEAVAARRGIAVIEDAAQSFGGEYKGRKAGSFGAIACTSFFPAKPLGCYGDGGMCFTNDDRFAEILRSIRVHGQGSDKYENVRIGINGRLDTLQAAILLAKFSIFPEEIDLRQEVFRRYNGLLSGAVATPQIPEGCKSAWAQYSIIVRNSAERSGLMAKLKGAGIPTAVYYPKPLHRQTAFAGLDYREGDFPVSEDCARRIFSLPMHPYLAAGDQRRIAALFP